MNLVVFLGVVLIVSGLISMLLANERKWKEKVSGFVLIKPRDPSMLDLSPIADQVKEVSIEFCNGLQVFSMGAVKEFKAPPHRTVVEADVGTSLLVSTQRSFGDCFVGYFPSEMLIEQISPKGLFVKAREYDKEEGRWFRIAELHVVEGLDQNLPPATEREGGKFHGTVEESLEHY